MKRPWINLKYRDACRICHITGRLQKVVMHHEEPGYEGDAHEVAWLGIKMGEPVSINSDMPCIEVYDEGYSMTNHSLSLFVPRDKKALVVKAMESIYAEISTKLRHALERDDQYVTRIDLIEVHAQLKDQFGVVKKAPMAGPVHLTKSSTNSEILCDPGKTGNRSPVIRCCTCEDCLDCLLNDPDATKADNSLAVKRLMELP